MNLGKAVELPFFNAEAQRGRRNAENGFPFLCGPLASPLRLCVENGFFRMSRIALLVVLLTLLQGCASRGFPAVTESGVDPQAEALLLRSAERHGLATWQQLRDVSVAYSGEWAWLVPRLQPELIDAGFRQKSEERLILGKDGLVGQQHQGPQGTKQVLRSAKTISVVYNGVRSDDRTVEAAAALVADGYRLFLTGPFYFLGGNAVLALAGSETVDGQLCDRIVAVRRPGLGLSAEDRFMLWLDREDGRLRRLRFSLEGLASTQGAIAEVDFIGHRTVGGVLWPVRFIERLKKPIPDLPVHDWQVIGLDLDRGLIPTEIGAAGFSGKAAAPAQPLP